MHKVGFTAVSLLLLVAMAGVPPARAITVAGVVNVGGVPDMSLCGFAGAIQLADGSNIRVRLALSDAEKTQGLSGLPKTQFGEDEALLMVGFNNGLRGVHMPDTYFNLDVFFLDKDLRVVGLQRNLTAHPGKTEPPKIETSRWVFARHIMEMRADSRIARQIQMGTVLRWQSQPTLKAIEWCMADAWKRQQW